MGEIIRTADKIIGMTAILINGYASVVLHLLYQLLPKRMELDGQNYHVSGHFPKKCGVVESVYNISVHSRIFKRKFQKCQLPGVSSAGLPPVPAGKCCFPYVAE